MSKHSEIQLECADCHYKLSADWIALMDTCPRCNASPIRVQGSEIGATK